MPPHGLISGLSMRAYFDSRSLFRQYQDCFLKQFGPELSGDIIELGGERHYRHGRFFPNATSFSCTNIARDCDERVDITAMPYADNSMDGFVCVSVLAHVFDIHAAIREIQRTLKSGGRLLLTVPLMFPVCDEVDYWRLSENAYGRLFEGYEIKAFVHLGGVLSTAVDSLQRPKRRYRWRDVIQKTFAFAIASTAGWAERLDRCPLGYGMYAEKTH